MKKGINLFIKKKRASDSPFSSERVKLYGLIFGSILFGIFLLFTVLQIQVKSQLNTLLTEKKQLLEFLLQNKEDEAKYGFFITKTDQLKNYLKDDAEFLPYYNILSQSINTTDTFTTLESIQIDKKKNTEFTVRFQEYQPAYEFLKYMESDTFLNNFIELKLINFSLSGSNFGVSKGYELQFKGRFKPISGNVAQK